MMQGMALGLVSIVGLLGVLIAVPMPDIPKAKQPFSETQPCVEPLAVIRREHGTLLKHQRDDTVHLGIRTPQHSLVQCINCHVAPAAEVHFCESCHTYAAVKIDCFECHRSEPE